MDDPILPRAVPEDVRSVPVVGLPLAMTTITAIFLALSFTTNCIRVYVNILRKSIGSDDGLVLFSQVGSRNGSS